MEKKQKRIIRKKRIRSKISGSDSRPRISVFRSNKHIHIQVVDDENNKSLMSISDKMLDGKQKKTKTAKSFETGELLATKLKKKKIESAVFDRSGYKYHGRIKATVEGLRKGGIKI